MRASWTVQSSLRGGVFKVQALTDRPGFAADDGAQCQSAEARSELCQQAQFSGERCPNAAVMSERTYRVGCIIDCCSLVVCALAQTSMLLKKEVLRQRLRLRKGV